jgi:hypothetical protein
MTSTVIEKKKTMQVTTLVPSSVVGKILILWLRDGVYYHNFKEVKVIGAVPIKRPETEFSEFRIIEYNPQTKEILVSWNHVSTKNMKWFSIWYDSNEDWVKLMDIDFVFIRSR